MIPMGVRAMVSGVLAVRAVRVPSGGCETV